MTENPGTPRFDERERLAALAALDIVGADVDRRFTLMTETARRMIGIPLVSITLVDDRRQWRVAWCGPLDREAPLHGGVCTTAMRTTERLFVVDDLSRDPRFSTSPFVAGPPHLRYYIGYPLRAPGGEPIGSFCLMDTVPRHLHPVELELVHDLGRWVQRELLAGVRPVRDDDVATLG